jgi:hypothetical protein
MRILYIGFDIEGVGGIATYSRHQIRALRQLGAEVVALSLDKQRDFAERGLVDRRIPFRFADHTAEHVGEEADVSAQQVVGHGGVPGIRAGIGDHSTSRFPASFAPQPGGREAATERGRRSCLWPVPGQRLPGKPAGLRPCWVSSVGECPE